MQNIDTIIFDMDGVIIDSEPIHKQVEQTLFQQLGLHISDEEHDAFTGMSGRNMWSQIIDKYALTLSVDQALNENNQLYEETLKQQIGMKPILGVKELIKKLYEKGYKLALASSSVMSHIHLVLGMFDLTPFFPYKISGDSLENSKPHPEIFLTIAQRMNSSPENCLVIEDSENGVKAAKAAGMTCIGYNNPRSGNQDLSLADVVIETFEEVGEFIF